MGIRVDKEALLSQLEKAGCHFDAPWLSTDAAVSAVQKAVQA